MKKLAIDEFIRRAREIHGDKYDYSKVEYINNRTKICIICPVHGEFWQTPNRHLDGQGCPKCGIKKRSAKKTLTTQKFINKAREIHGDKYDYSKVEYKNAKEKVCIICPKHGEFWQAPSCHLNCNGCPECGKIVCHKKTQLSQEEIIKRFEMVHNKQYDYSKVSYKGKHTKVCIICPVHGEFWQTPHNHLKGNGCPKCRNSHLEKFVEKVLTEGNIKFIEKYKTKWLGKQHLDFFLPEYNVAIECQGEQHFASFRFEKDDKKLLSRKKRDELKKKLCEENNIKLIYFSNIVKQDFCLGQKIIKDKNSLIEEIYV